MKKIVVFISFLVLTMFWVLLNSNKTSLPLAQGLAIQKLERLKQSSNEFYVQVLGLNQKKGNWKQVQVSYKALRISYKEIEFLLEYTDPTLVKENLNGAPLPRLEKSAPSLTILQPVGLQVIDELMAEQPDKSVIEALLVQADLFYKTVKDYQWQGKVYDRYIFEGAFVGLIRVFSLGLSGFDTPGTLCGVTDAKESLTSMFSFVSLFEPAIQQKNPKLFTEIKQLFSGAILQLEKEKHFEKFDRLAFLKLYVNPLIAKCKEAHLLLQIEFMEEVNPGMNALNYKASSLFDPTLLNPYFYVKLPENYRNEKVRELGKQLFYDPILSVNNKRSCASCHKPELAFSDGLKTSKAIEEGKFLKRNSPGLINAVYAERFFHDLRAESLEDQTEHVIFSSDEFNHDYYRIFDRLGKSKSYVALFSAAFPDYEAGNMNKSTLSFALSAYVSSLTSFNSPFDKFVRGEQSSLSKDAVDGFNLFMGKAACGTCHFAPVFNGTTPPLFFESESEVLGVPVDPKAAVWNLDPDKGRSEARVKEKVYFYEHSFKTPTVRNISLTAPYMHNGSFKDLETLMDFYNQGGGKGKGLNVPHQTLSDEPLNLSKQEIGAIIAFMQSLTDTTYSFAPPTSLPEINEQPELTKRVIGGEY
jgi:cytochrome c peroxidase